MRLDITGRRVEITPTLRQHIDRRIARLERLLDDSGVSAQIILTREKYRLKTEIVIHARGDHILRGLGEATAWPLSLRQATEKIEQQAKKMKGKWAGRKRRAASARTVATAVEAPARPRVIRAARYAVESLPVEAAAGRLAEGADAFLVFRDADSGAVAVLYRRKDGQLGLIEAD
ncbi:MAG TPA: ribosome-associated translation inhibitor RaiA [Vicinamibacterales bacterium]|nr:ribosome-associated translation inhibitor RaiA [Vicinamibacterales bacterium]